jgi:hypothetical protein
MMIYNPFVRPRNLSTASCVTAVLLASLLLVSPVIGGIRASGKYSGVVFFDRWGGCILFSGVYLMYISEDVKESLREYDGQAIEIDALQVIQPVNPGDGLIKRFTVLGPAPARQTAYTVEGTKLEAQPITIHPPFATLMLTITNERNSAAKINSSEIGFALLAQRAEDEPESSPSDGPSTAVITRTSVLNSHSYFEARIGDKATSYSYVITDTDRLPASFTLAPHLSKTTKITFMLPPGNYQFLAGYGGGVHENYLVVSNPVSIEFWR